MGSVTGTRPPAVARSQRRAVPATARLPSQSPPQHAVGSAPAPPCLPSTLCMPPLRRPSQICHDPRRASVTQDSRGSFSPALPSFRPRKQPHASLAAAAVEETPAAAAPADAPTDAGPTAAGLRTTIQEERLPNAHVRMTVTIPPEACEESYAKEIEWWRKKTDVPGFRKTGKKGKQVPTSMLLDTVGRDKVKRSTAQQILQLALPEAMAQSQYKDLVLGDSVKIETSIDELVAGFSVDKPLVYQVGFDVQPEVTWKSSYRELKVEVPSEGDEATDAVAIDGKLLSLRKQSGTLRVVTGRGLQRGDTVICDFDAERSDGGDPIIGAARKAMQLDTDTSDREFIPGLVDGMLGMVAGDSREVEITMPDTWDPPQLRGVRVKCRVSVKELFQWELPELTDELAEGQFPGCGGAEGLRQELLKVEAADRAGRQAKRVQEALTEAVANIAECEVPESLVRQMGEGEYQARLIELQQKGGLGLQQIQALATEELLEEYIRNKHGDLEDMQRTVLAFGAIYDQEGLQLADDEVEQEFKVATAEFDRQGQQYDRERLIEQITETLKGAKVLDFLKSTASITILPA